MIVKTRPMTQKEASAYIRVLENVSDEHAIYAAIAAIAIGTGARIGEVLKMRNGDVIDQNGCVMERVRRTVEKKRSRTPVYAESLFMSPHLRAIVQRYADQFDRISFVRPDDAYFFSLRYSGQPVTYQSAWEHNRVMLKHAGIDPRSQHVAFHGLRKTFATMVFEVEKELGGDGFVALDSVRQLLCHSNTAMTERYLNISKLTDEKRVHEIVAAKLVQENSHT